MITKQIAKSDHIDKGYSFNERHLMGSYFGDRPLAKHKEINRHSFSRYNDFPIETLVHLQHIEIH